MKIKKLDQFFFNDNPQFATFVGDDGQESEQQGNPRSLLLSSRIVHGNRLVPTIAPYCLHKDKHSLYGHSLFIELKNQSKQSIYKGVTSYHHEVFNNRALTKPNDFAIGVELEMNASTVDVKEALREGTILSSNYFHFHADSSLDYDVGVELNTVPLPSKVALSKEFWDGFCAMLRKYFYVNSRCGLHFHINRAFFFPDELASARVVHTVPADEASNKYLNFLNYMSLLYFNIWKGSPGKRLFSHFLSEVFLRSNNHYCPALHPTQTLLNLLHTKNVLSSYSGSRRLSKTFVDTLFTALYDSALDGILESRRTDETLPRETSFPFFSANRDELNVSRASNSARLDATIEFRRGQATLDPQKIHAMVCFIYYLSVFVRQATHRSRPLYSATTPETLEKFMTVLRDQKVSPRLSNIVSALYFEENRNLPCDWPTYQISRNAGKEKP